VDFVERTFSRLDDADAVLGVAGCLAKTAGLGTQALADDEAGRIVRSAVDPTRRELSDLPSDTLFVDRLR
jgi:hypothetical protein